MSVHPGIAVFDGLADRWRPPTPMSLSQWLGENIVLVDGDSAGRPWSIKGAPYLAEIADCLVDEHPCNLVTIRKSQQSGASILALGWCLYIADREPANTLYAAPSIDLLRDLNSGKLQPLIEAWHRRIGREVIKKQVPRSGEGSSTYEKVFAGGRLWLANANSVTDLSSKTIKKGVKDELSKWQDIEGADDPETLFFGRFTAFRRRRNYKILEISTPEVDLGDPSKPGHCRIDRSFLAGDQRYWHVPCPHCGDAFVHDFKQFRIDPERPSQSFYPCPHCGAVIDDSARPAMIRAGFWRAAMSGPERHPSFHLDAFVSLMVSYEAIAEDWLKADRQGETGRKGFANLVLGRPYEYRGDAPDHVRLMERREEGLKRGHIPPKGLILTAAADVQMRGIWLEVVAWAPNRESWTVEARYLDGSTESPDDGAFRQLDEWLDRDFPDAFGKTRRLDALGVDSGYRTHVVYAWARRHAHRINPNTGAGVVYAIKGVEGWGRPAMGTPSLVDINLEGQKIVKGTKVWPVGAWPLRSSLYADLGKLGRKSGLPEDPTGYCHFGDWLDENYFKQLTAEELVDKIYRGKMRREWRQLRPDNHFMDCRIYNMALAEHLGLSIMTEAEFAALARERGMPPSDALPLFKAPTSTETAPPSTERAISSTEKPAASITAPGAKPQAEDDDFDALMRRNSEFWT